MYLVIIFVAFSTAIAYKNNDIVNYINNYVVEHLEIYQLTIIRTFFRNHSTQHMDITEKLLKAHPSVIVNMRDEKENLRRIENLLSQRISKTTLNVIMIKTESDEYEILQELTQSIEFIINSTNKSVRPKCLILLVNEQYSVNLELFF